MKGLKQKKELAARALGCTSKRIVFDTSKLKEIKEAITKSDIKKLAAQGTIKIKPTKGVSRARARKRAAQRKKGRRRGHGSRKGKKGAREGKKRKWILKVRAQRRFVKMLKEKGVLTRKAARNLYALIKVGTFRNIAHLKLHIAEKGLIKK